MAGESVVGGIISISGCCVVDGVTKEEAEVGEAVAGGGTVEAWTGMNVKGEGDEAEVVRVGSVATVDGSPSGEDAEDSTEGNNSKGLPAIPPAGSDNIPANCEECEVDGRRPGRAALG